VKRKKSKFTNKDFIRAIAELTDLSMNNKKHIEILSDFFFNYLEMKGDKDNYVKYMEVKANELLGESVQGDVKIPGKSVQKDTEEEE
jgi:hypothetical protein|tara:strand:- start:1463 stop:1723 length:261 start_codon:yes stop_codon:yes gene_type:complete